MMVPAKHRRGGAGWFLLPALTAAVLAAFMPEAPAQVRVDISFKRKLYVMYEPVIANVSISNLSGRQLVLEDAEGRPWFGFNIEAEDGRLVPPIHPNYSLAPAAIGPGEKITRAVNLTPLYPLGEFGLYRVRAAVWVPEFQRFFSSPPLSIEITEGRAIWQQVVGVPGNEARPSLRTITLLSHKLSRTTRLYLRIEDKERGLIYATHQLGQFLSFGQPAVMLDVKNDIHILQNSAPKEFLYSHIDLDGKVIERKAYAEVGTRPSLSKKPDGTVVVAGGAVIDPRARVPEAEVATDKLSDRPVPLPPPER